MNTYRKNDSSDEVIINLNDLFFYALKHWKSLLVLVLIGIGLGGVLNVFQDNSYEPSYSDLVQMNKAYNYKILYEEQTAYNTEALGNLTEKDYVEGTLKYFINAGDDTLAIGEALDFTLKEYFLDDLRSILKYEGSNQYLCLVTAYNYDKNTNTSVYINAQEKEAAEIDNSIIVTYVVSYVEEENAKKILDYLEEKVNEFISGIEESGDYEINKFEQVNKGVKPSNHMDIYSWQSSVAEQATETLEKMNECLSAFNEKQLSYYNSVYLNQKISVNKINIRLFVIGAFLSIVCWGVYVIWTYFANNSIRFLEQISEYYNIYVMGRVVVETKKKKGIDFWLSKWHNASKIGECSINYLVETITMLNKSNVVLSLISESIEENQLSVALNSKCDYLNIVGPLNQDEAGIKTGRNADGIILVFSLGKTKKRDFEVQLDICEAYNIPVLAVIAVDNF